MILGLSLGEGYLGEMNQNEALILLQFWSIFPSGFVFLPRDRCGESFAFSPLSPLLLLLVMDFLSRMMCYFLRLVVYLCHHSPPLHWKGLTLLIACVNYFLPIIL
uniref:Uncharacterized protein n=1 Tax=Opuntia streptacantha TaxID=393608 RepID=A0A7C8YXS1_OPUST